MPVSLSPPKYKHKRTHRLSGPSEFCLKPSTSCFQDDNTVLSLIIEVASKKIFCVFRFPSTGKSSRIAQSTGLANHRCNTKKYQCGLCGRYCHRTSLAKYRNQCLSSSKQSMLMCRGGLLKGWEGSGNGNYVQMIFMACCGEVMRGTDMSKAPLGKLLKRQHFENSGR